MPLSYDDAVTKLAEILIELGLSRPGVATAEAKMLLPPKKRVTAVQSVDAPEELSELLRPPVGTISVLVLLSATELTAKLPPIIEALDLLEPFMKVLGSGQPRIEAVRTYEQLSDLDWRLAYNRGISLVLTKVLATAEQQQGWLRGLLAEMLFPNEQITATEARLIELIATQDVTKLNNELFPTVVSFATELTEFGSLRGSFYSPDIDLIGWALDLLDRSGGAWEFIDVIASAFEYEPIANWDEYDAFLRFYNWQDFDVIRFLVTAEFKVFSEGHNHSLLYSPED